MTATQWADYLKGRADGTKLANPEHVFDPSTLAGQFVPYFHGRHNDRVRVRVRFSHGEELTGTIGITTGWRPCFLLMRRSNAYGSSYTLGTQDRIVAVKHGRTYQEVGQ